MRASIATNPVCLYTWNLILLVDCRNSHTHSDVFLFFPLQSRHSSFNKEMLWRRPISSQRIFYRHTVKHSVCGIKSKFFGATFLGVVMGNAFFFFVFFIHPSISAWLIIILVLNNWILEKPTFLSLGDGVVAIRRRDLVEVFSFFLFVFCIFF